MSSARLTWCLLLSLALAGCGEGGDAVGTEDGARGDAVVGGAIVSTVDGHPITVEDVRHAVQSTGVPPEVALRRLQDELLLARAAHAAGLDDDPEVQRTARRAQVQAVLERAVEDAHGPGEVDAASLEEAFEADLARFESPERRRSVHVLARLAEDATPDAEPAARAWIEEIHAELAAAEDPRAAAFEIQRRPPVARPFEVVVEEVDPVARTEVDPAYARAIFGLAEPGLAPRPVRSGFGWHAIVLTEIVPAYEATREEAIETLRSERVTQRRAQALSTMIGELASQRGVQLYQGAVNAYLARPDLLGEPR